ncbi:MAG: hypothetical protein M1831_000156 [Alyxoria varia]|nr:MAG: hypothetical protein M1831_000156 [Alyxoria varia]
MSLKEAFDSLSPIDYEDVPTDTASLKPFISTSLAHAETLANSVPAAYPTTKGDDIAKYEPLPANSASKLSETLCDHIPPISIRPDADQEKAWGKPLNLAKKDNPLGIMLFKRAGHDKHGAWFARRSVHQGIGFEKMKKAMQREFLESLKKKEGPGSGAVRGVAADRRMEKHIVEGLGRVEVWQTSSVFPGPVTPRESLTLIMTSDNALGPASSVSTSTSTTEPLIPRHYMTVSRPTAHPDAPNRAGLVKMTYESVEMIREVPIEGNENAETNPVEWLMITRSDPGGGIPRFMVERGTPAGIAADVGKWLEWACSKSDEDLMEELDEEEADAEIAVQSTETDKVEEHEQTEAPTKEEGSNAANIGQNSSASEHNEAQPGVLSKVTEAISGYVPAAAQQAYAEGGLTAVPAKAESYSSSSSSIASSDGSFASAMSFDDKMDGAATTAKTRSTTSLAPSGQTNKTLSKVQARREQAQIKHDKTMADLEHKAVKLKEKEPANEKETKEREKALSRNDAALRKQEERHQQELKKLDEQHEKEVRREEERAKKAKAKDEVSKLKKERNDWKIRAEISEKEADILAKQVQGLQRENTALAARIGTGVEGGDDVVRQVREGLGDSNGVTEKRSKTSMESKGSGSGSGSGKSDPQKTATT